MTARSKSFNTTGPCRPEMHYMLPPEARLSSADLRRLVEQELYWVLHAPRCDAILEYAKNFEVPIPARPSPETDARGSLEGIHGIVEPRRIRSQRPRRA